MTFGGHQQFLIMIEHNWNISLIQNKIALQSQSVLEILKESCCTVCWRRCLLIHWGPKQWPSVPSGSSCSPFNTAEPQPAVEETKLSCVSDGHPSLFCDKCLLWTGCEHVWQHFYTFYLLVEKHFGFRVWSKSWAIVLQAAYIFKYKYHVLYHQLCWTPRKQTSTLLKKRSTE